MCNEYICSHFIESYYKQKTGVINMNQVFSLSSRNLQSEGYKTNIQIRVQTEIHSLIEVCLFRRARAYEFRETMESAWRRRYLLTAGQRASMEETVSLIHEGTCADVCRDVN